MGRMGPVYLFDSLFYSATRSDALTQGPSCNLWPVWIAREERRAGKVVNLTWHPMWRAGALSKWLRSASCFIGQESTVMANLVSTRHNGPRNQITSFDDTQRDQATGLAGTQLRWALRKCGEFLRAVNLRPAECLVAEHCIGGLLATQPSYKALWLRVRVHKSSRQQMGHLEPNCSGCGRVFWIEPKGFQA